MPLKILDNVTGTGVSAAQASKGKARTLFCQGTVVGTVSLEVSIDGGTTWVTNADLTFTENSVVNFEVANGALIRGNYAGSTGVSLILQ